MSSASIIRTHWPLARNPANAMCARCAAGAEPLESLCSASLPAAVKRRPPCLSMMKIVDTPCPFLKSLQAAFSSLWRKGEHMADKFLHEALYRGQEAIAKLGQAQITICGAGALGSHLIDTLARQGVRRLTVIDMDRVEEHNIGTQIY